MPNPEFQNPSSSDGEEDKEELIGGYSTRGSGYSPHRSGYGTRRDSDYRSPEEIEREKRNRNAA